MTAAAAAALVAADAAAGSSSSFCFSAAAAAVVAGATAATATATAWHRADQKLEKRRGIYPAFLFAGFCAAGMYCITFDKVGIMIKARLTRTGGIACKPHGWGCFPRGVY